MASKTKNNPPFDGAIIIDKPAGMTSHDVVSRLRRILGTKKIGHTGTLDPFATGVLVMLVGKATRLARFLDKDEKSYDAVVRFGFETDTGDREGVPKRGFGDEGRGERESEGKGDGQFNDRSADDSPALSEAKTDVENNHGPANQKGITELHSQKELVGRVNEVLSSFTGNILQTPPMYSAKKVKGKKLYELARKGIEIEREPVAIKISELAVRNEITPGVYSSKTAPDDNEIVLSVTCSAGTYIRTLAEDIGRKAGIGCHLAELRRTKAGRFGLENAVTLEDLEEIVEAGQISTHVVGMSELVGHLPSQTLEADDVFRISLGQKIDARFDVDSVLEIRLIDSGGELVAIGQTDPEGKIQPKAVFVSE